MLDELGVNDIRLINTKNRNTLFPDLPLVVQPSNLFSTPVPASDTTSFTSSTPKMDCVFSVVSINVMIMFTRSLDFLDSQSSFHLNVGYNPTMFRLL